jgi:hypothetical protein
MVSGHHFVVKAVLTVDVRELVVAANQENPRGIAAKQRKEEGYNGNTVGATVDVVAEEENGFALRVGGESAEDAQEVPHGAVEVPDDNGWRGDSDEWALGIEDWVGRVDQIEKKAGVEGGDRELPFAKGGGRVEQGGVGGEDRVERHADCGRARSQRFIAG